jgi:hypothetical protein
VVLFNDFLLLTNKPKKHLRKKYPRENLVVYKSPIPISELSLLDDSNTIKTSKYEDYWLLDKFYFSIGSNKQKASIL